MSAAQWVSLTSVAVLVGLSLGGLVWFIRSKRQARRRAQALAQLARNYRTTQPKTTGPDEPVTVAELVARQLAEGRAVRLNWEEGQDRGSDEKEWPTGVLPRIPPDDDHKN